VREVMAPFSRIRLEEITKVAARKIVEHGIMRLGIFDGDNFLGWVLLSDLSRDFSKKSLLERLHAHNEAENSCVRIAGSRSWRK
jgi:hypothetical protein